MRQIPFILISLFFLSCNQVDKTHKSYRDSVIDRYFAMVDSSGQYDTADSQYKTLKAYAYNDTTSLKKIDSLTVIHSTNRQNWDLWTSDIPLPELKQLNADEAYRFILSHLGSPAYETVTIYKNDTSIKLHYLFYFHDKENSKFKKGKDFEKQISKDQWDNMTSKLRYSDYWGLKTENGIRGDDGGDLTLIAYKRSGDNERNHYVHRWLLTTLNDTFYYVYNNLLDKKERQFPNN